MWEQGPCRGLESPRIVGVNAPGVCRMLCVRMASGEEILQMTDDDFEVMAQTCGTAVKALKQRLQALLGMTRFRQRLLIDGRELHECDELWPSMELELVLLNFCPADDAQCRELYAAVGIDSVERTEAVLALPQDPDVSMQQDRTALQYAAVCGSAECMRLLLEAGADRDRTSEDGYTPLALAAAQGHLEILGILIQARADLRKTARGRFAPLSVACCQGHLEAVRFLLDSGAETDPDVCRATPLGIACAENHLEVARLLLDAGADKNARMSGSVTALHLACQRGHTEIVQLLLEARVDTIGTGESSLTALLLIAAEHHDVLRLLLRSQAEHLKFGQRTIAAVVAVEQCQFGAARILLADAVSRSPMLAECLSGMRKLCVC